MTLKERVFNGIALDKDNVKGKLLSRSLLWMGFGLAFIIIISFLVSKIPVFKDLMHIFAGGSWFMMLIINIALLLGIFFTLRNPDMPIGIPAVLYAFFAIYEGFFISYLINYFLPSNADALSTLLLLMLIPAGIFILMGIIAYTNIIDFSKLLPFCSFVFIGLLVMSIVLIFVNSIGLIKWYLLLSAALFVIWIGFDIQMIKRTENQLISSYQPLDKKAVNRIAFMLGFQLFLDFINLLIILIRLISFSRS